MPISSRLVIGSTIALLSVAFLTLFGIVATTVWLGERTRMSYDEVLELRDTRTAAVELRSALQTAEASQRGYLVSANEIYLAPFANAKAQTLRQLGILQRALGSDADATRLLARLGAIVADKLKEMDESIALKSAFRDQDAMELLKSNRGKALMDEANVFLSGVIRRTDDRLTAEVHEQRENANWLRWVSIIGGLIIMAVVGGVIATVIQYAREIVQARDEVKALNSSLEERVRLRTSDLARARDRAEVLLAEVNHRVANSLALVTSMVSLQAKASTDAASKQALNEIQGRIYAIAAVHKRLYSSGDARFVALDEYFKTLLDHLAASMRAEGSGANLRSELDPVKLKTDAAVNLGIVATELVTNAFKYAYPVQSGEIRVKLKQLSDREIELVVEDDGIGRSGTVASGGTGLGTRIVSAMANTLGGRIDYAARNPGTSARLVIPVPAA
ncbi:MAG TPA: CHASE3 domain-containing protein [Xanthobacteraceae bacterium]|nr:CHASE3 domain-containing protein [Xanthobacteraceae bacterium]